LHYVKSDALEGDTNSLVATETREHNYCHLMLW